MPPALHWKKSARDAGEQKRDATKHYDSLRSGVVNDAIIDFAKKDTAIKIKSIKVLSSLLRAAKIRKSAFESTHKGQVYTYTNTDLEAFDLWKKLQAADTSLPDDPSSDADLIREKKSGPMAAAIQAIANNLQSGASSVTPSSPVDFANAFYAAKRAHEAQSVLSLKQKLDMIDADVAAKIISKEAGDKYKQQVTDRHYTF